jgi:SpoVK/Ycf46/Vps4 family AAA+-type ATPase
MASIEIVLEGERAAESIRVGRRELRYWSGRSTLLLYAPGAADWRIIWQELADVRAPIAVALEPAAVELAAVAAPREPALIPAYEHDAEARARLWQSFLPPGESIDSEGLATLAALFRFSPRAMTRTVRRATADVALAPPGARKLTTEALARSAREVAAASMGPLAQRLPLPYSRADLVAPQRVNSEIDLAIAWVRHQAQVLDRWGFGRRIAFGKGLAAVFAGPSGTGKTMAAQVLARELGLDAYRVDLSRIMSKYIGETEKNLGAVFDEARASGAVLFFDEADALFGKRSEVSDAHDRYANVEIGYLLQRMEEHDGVTILATNRLRDVDEAFLRRFHIIADFPMPSEEDRLRIWQGMLPPALEREPDLDLRRLARDFEISGGDIKNAVLAAAYMAAAQGKPVGMHHLKAALRREMIKSGKVIDERELHQLE